MRPRCTSTVRGLSRRLPATSRFVPPRPPAARPAAPAASAAPARPAGRAPHPMRAARRAPGRASRRRRAARTRPAPAQRQAGRVAVVERHEPLAQAELGAGPLERAGSVSKRASASPNAVSTSSRVAASSPGCAPRPRAGSPGRPGRRGLERRQQRPGLLRPAVEHQRLEQVGRRGQVGRVAHARRGQHRRRRRERARRLGAAAVPELQDPLGARRHGEDAGAPSRSASSLRRAHVLPARRAPVRAPRSTGRPPPARPAAAGTGRSPGPAAPTPRPARTPPAAGPSAARVRPAPARRRPATTARSPPGPAPSPARASPGPVPLLEHDQELGHRRGVGEVGVGVAARRPPTAPARAPPRARRTGRAPPPAGRRRGVLRVRREPGELPGPRSPRPARRPPAARPARRWPPRRAALRRHPGRSARAVRPRPQDPRRPRREWPRQSSIAAASRCASTRVPRSAAASRAAAQVRHGHLGIARRARRPGRRQQPPRPRAALRREPGGPVERPRLGGHAAALAGALGGPLEQRRRLLVRPVGGRSELPRPPLERSRARRAPTPACGGPPGAPAPLALPYAADRTSG